jgi:hypothetical protein
MATRDGVSATKVFGVSGVIRGGTSSVGELVAGAGFDARKVTPEACDYEH